MAFVPSKSAGQFSRSDGGGRIPPPPQLTYSRKPTSNRVKRSPVARYLTNKKVKSTTVLASAVDMTDKSVING